MRLPTEPKLWTVTASRYLLQDKWVTVRADQCRTARGIAVDPYYVLEYPDRVQVVAFDAERRILVTQQYRHAAGAICLELPCGMVEAADETPLAAARRELREETGYASDHFELVGCFSPNPATHTNTLHCFVAYNACRSQPISQDETSQDETSQDETSQDETSQDETEEVSSGFMSVEDVMSAIETGRFAQALHIPSLFLSLKHAGALAFSDIDISNKHKQ